MAQELKDVQDTELSASSETLRSLLLRLFTRPPELELAAHSRAANPLFTDGQIQEFIDMAYYWGVDAIRSEALHRTYEHAEWLGDTRAVMRKESERDLRRREFEMRELVLQALRARGVLWDNRFVVEDILIRAKYWVQWRVRGFISGAYGPCTEVIERAAWAFREHLFSLECDAHLKLEQDV